MDNSEAIPILDETVASVRGIPYRRLVETYLDESQHLEIGGKSGARYQVEVQGFWDDPRLPDKNLHIIVSIDDGGWRAFSPLFRSFIVAPDGSFVGE